jgi:hypothetical protein
MDMYLPCKMVEGNGSVRRCGKKNVETNSSVSSNVYNVNASVGLRATEELRVANR